MAKVFSRVDFAAVISLPRQSAHLAQAVHIAGPAVAAIAWWIVPILGVSAAIGYGIWVSKYKGKFESATHRSVDRFQNFQRTFHPERAHHLSQTVGQPEPNPSALSGKPGEEPAFDQAEARPDWAKPREADEN